MHCGFWPSLVVVPNFYHLTAHWQVTEIVKTQPQHQFFWQLTRQTTLLEGGSHPPVVQLTNDPPKFPQHTSAPRHSGCSRGSIPVSNSYRFNYSLWMCLNPHLIGSASDYHHIPCINYALGATYCHVYSESAASHIGWTYTQVGEKNLQKSKLKC